MNLLIILNYMILQHSGYRATHVYIKTSHFLVGRKFLPAVKGAVLLSYPRGKKGCFELYFGHSFHFPSLSRSSSSQPKSLEKKKNSTYLQCRMPKREQTAKES